MMDNDTDSENSEISSNRRYRESSRRRNTKEVNWKSHGIPTQYVDDPYRAEPELKNLTSLVEAHSNAQKKVDRDFRRSVANVASTNPQPAQPEGISLQSLLSTAELDIELHQARQRAVIANDPSLLRPNSIKKTYDSKNLSVDETYQKQQTYIAQLCTSAPKALAALDQAPSRHNTTHTDIARERLTRWKDALEIYVHCPDNEITQIDMLGLLEKLCEKCNEEEELLEALSAASQMCTSLAEQTCEKVKQLSENAVHVEDGYRIKLEVHKIFVNQAAEKTVQVENMFHTHGRAAMQIGQKLERAEVKRRQCEAASLLLRRWWTMESLAEQEEISGVEIKVVEEIRGVISQASCKMHPLFTRRENSLEAAKALKQLRMVVKSRGNTANIGIGPTAAETTSMMDATSLRRFELTRNLIFRTGEVLEQRLLNDFSEVFGKGGAYHFTAPAGRNRPGTLDWRKLRELAEALMHFDNGRNLIKRYVELVVTSKFPELFKTEEDFVEEEEIIEDEEPEGEDDEEYETDSSDEFDMESTASRLSQLFHRVSEVCTAEFELIAHVFSSTFNASSSSPKADQPLAADPVPLQVARLLLQRVISDSKNGLQARISDLLAQTDRGNNFDAAANKLDTFVLIHSKAAFLFCHLRDAAKETLIPQADNTLSKDGEPETDAAVAEANANAVLSLVQFLTSQEMTLSDGYRRGYLNLELRLLHHRCCSTFERVGAKLLPPITVNMPDDELSPSLPQQIEYIAPSMPLDKESLIKGGIAVLLDSVLKGQVQRQPLADASKSLERANDIFGGGHGLGGTDADSTARAITSIYTQMCDFYGDAYLYPIIEAVGEMLDVNHPTTPPFLPFNENLPAHDLGVDGKFWSAIERVHSAAKSFDRVLWAEQRSGSAGVWEVLVQTGSRMHLSLAKERRMRLFRELEEKGEATIHRALDTISRHAHWILVTGGESMLATGGSRLLQNLTGSVAVGAGPYAIPTQNSLEAANSPAVKSLIFCLRAQFGNVQAALTSQSLSAFWTALSMRIYDILCARLLQHYSVSTIGAAILSRDVESLRRVAMLAGTNHSHWDTLKELLTLYMTPPEALKTILAGGIPGEKGGLFLHAGREKSLVFLSRRTDFRVKTNAGLKKSAWAQDLFRELNILKDPTDNPNIALYAAERKNNI